MTPTERPSIGPWLEATEANHSGLLGAASTM